MNTQKPLSAASILTGRLVQARTTRTKAAAFPQSHITRPFDAVAYAAALEVLG